MRIALRLLPKQKLTAISLNYQYSLAAAIYKILGKASPAYAAFLHNRGYTAPSGRLMKLFVFSKLWNPHTQRKGSTLVSNRGSWSVQVGSPMLEEFVQNFVLGLFETAEIPIGGPGWHAAFQVEQVETLPVPDFKERMRFKCLSPFSVSRPVEINGTLKPEYLLPDDSQLSERLQNNLLEKHTLIHGTPPANMSFSLQFEKRDRPKTKMIAIKEGREDQTNRRAIESHFTATGSLELMQTAWECGLGEAGAMGFGMVEAVRDRG